MWSIFQNIPIFNPPPPQTETPAPFLFSSETTISSSSTLKPSDNLASQATTPFCCAKYQIPTSCPTSHILTLFLRALTLRQQEIHHPNQTPSSSSTNTFFQPFPSNLTLTESAHSLQNATIIELETSAKQPNYLSRIYKQKYYIPRQDLQRTDVEIYPGGAFYEISFQEVARIKGGGNWDFLRKDEAVKDRVSWRCEGCGGAYWARVIAGGL